MTDKEREAMEALMELVRETLLSIADLENQLVIRTKERDDVLRLLGDTQAASRQEVLWQQAQDRAEYFKKQAKRLSDELNSIGSILSESYGTEDGTANEARRVMRHVKVLEDTNRKIGRRREEVETAARAVATIYCPDSESDIDYQEKYMDAMDELGKVLDKDPSEDPGEEIDGAKYYGAVFKKAHDILGWDNPCESLEDAAERIVDKLAALENLSPQSECERLRGVISVVHDILGRVSTNLVNAIAADAQRVVGERDEWESSAKRFHQERDGLVAKLYEVRNAARAVCEVYGRVVKCNNEDGRIARHNDLDDAMGALDEVLTRDMGVQEGQIVRDYHVEGRSEMVAAEFTRCITRSHAGQCLDAQGHDGPHVFERKADDAEFVRCTERDHKGQCLGVRNHTGPHEYERGDGKSTFPRCQYHSDVEDSTFYGVRCVLKLDHECDHRF